MSRVIVAGMVSVRASLRVAMFPVPYVSSQRVPDAISVRLASTGWTAARTLQRLGTDVSLATYVGADKLGQWAIHGLRECGLYGPSTVVCPRQPRVVVLHDHAGNRSSNRDHPHSVESRYPTEVFASVLDSQERWDLALLTSVGFTTSLIPIAIERGLPIATDLQLVTDIYTSPYQERIRVTTILACSNERLSISPESWVVELWTRFGTDIVLVGCGAAGAVLGLRAGRRIWRIDAITPRGVCYTSGAGDVLLSAFIHFYLTLNDPLAAARNAVLAAGWNVGGHPDDEPGPTATTVAELRTNHGLPTVHRLR